VKGILRHDVHTRTRRVETHHRLHLSLLHRELTIFRLQRRNRGLLHLGKRDACYDGLDTRTKLPAIRTVRCLLHEREGDVYQVQIQLAGLERTQRSQRQVQSVQDVHRGGAHREIQPLKSFGDELQSSFVTFQIVGVELLVRQPDRSLIIRQLRHTSRPDACTPKAR
jgi:hypothetical protein